MHLLLSLTIGLTVGVLARRIWPGRERGTWVTSILLGICGSFLGGDLAQMVGVYATAWEASLLVSVLGAVALLLIYHAFVGRRASS